MGPLGMFWGGRVGVGGGVWDLIHSFPGVLGGLQSSVSAVLVVEWPLVGGGWVLAASWESPLAGFSRISGGLRGATDTRVFPWFSSSTGYASSACTHTHTQTHTIHTQSTSTGCSSIINKHYGCLSSTSSTVFVEAHTRWRVFIM